MSTYIDKEAFIKEIVKIDPRRLSTKTIGEALDRIPAANVVEVARCKEIFAAIDATIDLICAMTGLDIAIFGKYAELKKKIHGKREEG